MLTARFPFSIFYNVIDDTVYIYAILDCRRDTSWIRERIK